MNIRDCKAIVSGGASGLGRAVVERIVENGGEVLIIDLNEIDADYLKKHSDNVYFIKTNICSEEDVNRAIEYAIRKMGSINSLINCAGIAFGRKVISKKGSHDLMSFKKIIDVNLVGTFNVIRLVVEKMVLNTVNESNERGVIINTASVAAYEGQIGQAAYSASKGGIISMTLPLARELATYGIRVSSIAPGIFETPMVMGMSDELKESLAKDIPFPKRLGKPYEYSQLVESILENTMINGSTIRIDGAVRMQAI